jgi:hypothetical protein
MVDIDPLTGAPLVPSYPGDTTDLTIKEPPPFESSVSKEEPVVKVPPDTTIPPPTHTSILDVEPKVFPKTKGEFLGKVKEILKNSGGDTQQQINTLREIESLFPE